MVTIQISPPSGRGFDLIRQIKDMPWQNIGYEGKPNLVPIDGFPGAGKDAAQRGLTYMLLYGSCSTLSDSRNMEALAWFGRTIALEDFLEELIEKPELDRFPKYSGLEDDLIQTAVNSILKGQKDERAAEQAMIKIRSERANLYNKVSHLLPVNFVRSVVTRPLRKGEVSGVAYDFVTEDEFFRMAEKGDLLEISYVHNKGWYGTPRFVPVENTFVLKQIEPNGCEMIIKRYDPNANIKPHFMIIYIPSELVEKRLRRRGTEETELQERLRSVAKEQALNDEIRRYAPSSVIVNNRHIYDTRLKAYNLFHSLGLVSQRIEQYPVCF